MIPFSQRRRRLQNCCQHDSSILHTGEEECKIATILTSSNLTVKKKIARIAAMKIPSHSKVETDCKIAAMKTIPIS
jgi:hypothetical protein